MIERNGIVLVEKEVKEVPKMQNNSNLQDVYLASVRRNRLNVTMFLMNGYQLRGVITGFDSFTVVLNSDGR